MRRVLATLIITSSFTAIALFGPGPVAGGQPQRAEAAATTTSTTAPVDWKKIVEHQKLEKLWWAEVVKQQRAHAAYLRLLRYAHAVATAQAYPHGLCGGDLPSCAVLHRESKGDIRIWNGRCYAPTGWRGLSPCGSSSASGKWQFVRRTWATCQTGYVNAADAPERVQDDCARHILRHYGNQW